MDLPVPVWKHISKCLMHDEDVVFRTEHKWRLLRTCKTLYMMMIRPMIAYARYTGAPYVNHFGDNRICVKVRLWCGCANEARMFLRDIGKTYKKVHLMGGGQLWEDCLGCRKKKRTDNARVYGLILDDAIPDCYIPSSVHQLVISTNDQKLIAGVIGYRNIETLLCDPYVRLVQPDADHKFDMTVMQYRRIITNRSVFPATINIIGMKYSGKPVEIECRQISINETNLRDAAEIAPQYYCRTCIVYTGDPSACKKFITLMRLPCNILIMNMTAQLSFKYE